MWKKIIDNDLIIINPRIKDKDELFCKMVNHVYNHDYILNQKLFLEALRERENMSNTELIEGVAFPHARSESVDRLFLCIVILQQGIDYENEELGPARIIFFSGCSPQDAKSYLQLLARSSRLLRNQEFREQLMDCLNPQQVIALLDKYSDEESPEESEGQYLMILTLHESIRESELMTDLIEVGVTNACLMDSISIAKKLSYELPVFAGLSYMAPGKSSQSQVVLGFLEKKTQALRLQKLLQEQGIDLNCKGVGFIQLLKIEHLIGNPESELDI
ncbi:MAG: PTS sugar transporter subunit IIA [Candidatus Cloacimonetes bacterium]|nr:PTS sugar transporter subunit IIA [Candidatus Cloacimonadota bacterium]